MDVGVKNEFKNVKYNLQCKFYKVVFQNCYTMLISTKQIMYFLHFSLFKMAPTFLRSSGVGFVKSPMMC